MWAYRPFKSHLDIFLWWPFSSDCWSDGGCSDPGEGIFKINKWKRCGANSRTVSASR